MKRFLVIEKIWAEIMRKLNKITKPQILVENEDIWLEDLKLDPKNETKKFRYRHADIKKALKDETAEKYVYCESKIGHNTPGDIEHKIPSSKEPCKRFYWDNLTIACTECNRRKNDFYNSASGFVDPYIDDVEQILEHLGPIVTWRPGDTRAEVAVRILELCSESRFPLFKQKLSKINELMNVVERFLNEEDPVLKRLLEKQMKNMGDISAEYSAMVLSILKSKGLI
jgi:5-methylcytosine-specific restriction endonuclease McrA